ncbi:hypothetical protein [Curtobacterium sp. Curtsp57]|uniref:hypothetical protein n=1 Tax=Curtobacterium sp. Curtsp57 TaxID=3243047 RepID=UPI0039B6109B
MHNLIAGMAGGKRAKELMLDGPSAARKVRLFAPTIAEFDVDGFMEVIASGKV